MAGDHRRAPAHDPADGTSVHRRRTPWFDYYNGDRKALSGADSLAGLKSVAETGVEKRESPLPENEPLGVSEVIRLTPDGKRVVREYPAGDPLK